MKDTNLIIGKTNTGKTKYYLLEKVRNAIKKGENLCILNTRDEYFKTFSKELQKNGYHVLVLNIKDATKSNGYNPLQVPYELYKEGKKDKAVSLINDLALELFKEDSPSIDPFWQNMASSYFMGLVLILFQEAELEKINLGSIQVMMSQGEEKYEDMTYLRKYLMNIDVTDTIYTMLSPIVFAPAETKGSILSVCKQKLNVYMCREELLNLLNTNDINIRNLKEKTAIMIMDNKTTDLANIMIDQLVEVSPIPFTYILDNLDHFSVIRSLQGLLKDATYHKNKVYAAIHNIEQWRELYGKYIDDKFENVIYIKEQSEDMVKKVELGNDSNYPTLKPHKHEYMNFKQLVEAKK